MAEKFKIAFVDNLQSIDDQSIDAAEAEMTAEKDGLRGVGGFFKKVWQHNLARNYYRQKKINQARQQIIETGNVFAAAGGSQAEFELAQEAIVDRFISDHEESIHQLAGETRRVIDSSPKGQEFEKALKGLIDSFVSGQLDEVSLEEEKIRLLNNLPDFDFKSGQVRVGCADNLVEIAKQIKQSLSHQVGLVKLDYDLEIIIGRAASGVRTEAKYNRTDRLLEKLGKTKIGSLVNESTLGLAVAGVVAGVSSISQSVSQATARMLGGLALGASLTGGLAAARESQELKRERKQHGREKAQGKRFKENDPRRAEMEKFNYQTIKSVDILDRLNVNLGEIGASENKEQGIKQLINDLADVEARIRLSDQQKIDLIAFSNLTQVESERFQIDLARAQLKVSLRRLVDNKLIKLDGSIDDYLEKLTSIKTKELMAGDNGIQEKDRLFDKMRKRRARSAGVKAAAIGLAIGLASQEVTSLFRSDQQGLIEGVLKKKSAGSGPQKLTFLEKVRTMLVKEPQLDQVTEMVQVGEQQFQLPVGTTVEINNDGTYSLFSGGKAVIGNLEIVNGQLSAESQGQLIKEGISWTTQESSVVTTTGASSVIDRFKESFSNIKRQLWYDNDTKAFDKNELKLFWGGQHGSGVDQEGNILFDVRRMTSDGSYTTMAGQKLSADAQQLIKNNGLKLMLSLSKGTQNQVIEIPINADGIAIIPKDSLAASLFHHSHGSTNFLGQFAEVAQVMGTDKNGAEIVRMLATHVGEGMPDQSTIVSEILHKIDLPNLITVSPPPIIPIMSRRPLEPAIIDQLKPDQFITYTGYQDRELSEEEKSSYEQYFSPRIKENSQAKLNQQEELDWLFKQKQVNEPEHLKKIDKIVQGETGLKKLPGKTKLMVCMAVGAAFESENIYKTLRLYSQQDSKTLEKTVFVLNVNWFDDDEQDPKKLQQIKKTIAEIKKIQQEFPQLQINAFQQKYSRQQMTIERGFSIHGQFIKDVHDVALRSLQLSGLNQEVLLLSNDADCKGMSADYLEKLVETAEKNMEADAFLGRIEWDTERWPDHPGFHLSVRFMQFLDLVSRYPRNGQPCHIPTSGANSAVRASTLAAIGGMDPANNIGAGADVDMGRRIKYARGSTAEQAINYRHEAWIDTNGDRAFNYYAHGQAVVEMWSDFNQGGYKGRGDLGVQESFGPAYYRERTSQLGPSLEKDSSGEYLAEEIGKDWPKIIARFEHQINGGLRAYFQYDLILWSQALTATFGSGKPARWIIDHNYQVKITTAGQEWLKQQVGSFQTNKKQDLLYQRGGIKA